MPTDQKNIQQGRFQAKKVFVWTVPSDILFIGSTAISNN